ncbi:MAG TPA: DUF937 domain-containing protein [Pedomonas sp.]|nr:DUF937 domain-containing protein [Pedomonas sp.]
MNVGDMLKQTGALDAISQQLGIDRQSAQAGASALLPSLLGGFRKQAQMEAGGTEGGAGNLLGLLGSLGGGSLLDAVTSPRPASKEPGDRILGQVFGSKEVSRTVAGQAAQSTGIDPSVLKKMLPLLAMAVSGYLASRSGAGGAQGQMLQGQMLQGQRLQGQRLQGAGGQRGGSEGGGGLLGLLDMDGDGNPLDDILRMAGRFRR